MERTKGYKYKRHGGSVKVSGLLYEDSYNDTIMKANKFIKVVPDDGDMLVLVSGGAVIPSIVTTGL